MVKKKELKPPKRAPDKGRKEPSFYEILKKSADESKQKKEDQGPTPERKKPKRK